MSEYGDIFIPGPSGGSAGSAAGSAAGLALTPILGPLAPIAGGFLGGLLGGGSPSGSAGGLGDALNAGLGSLFGSKSSASNTSSQTVETAQSTNVNVQNVLGSRNFGNYDPSTGQFDTFQALSDIFAIKAAQDQARLATGTPAAPAAPAAKKPLNFIPLIVAAGLALTFYLTKKKE